MQPLTSDEWKAAYKIAGDARWMGLRLGKERQRVIVAAAWSEYKRQVELVPAFRPPSDLILMRVKEATDVKAAFPFILILTLLSPLIQKIIQALLDRWFSQRTS